jgi:hypothetical protein
MAKVWNKRDPKCPKDAIYVGRPSKWGNPFKIGKDAHGRYWDREQVIELYRHWLLTNEQDGLLLDLPELRGRDLVCWCAPLPCHADVLLELANKPRKGE